MQIKGNGRREVMQRDDGPTAATQKQADGRTPRGTLPSSRMAREASPPPQRSASVSGGAGLRDYCDTLAPAGTCDHCEGWKLSNDLG